MSESKMTPPLKAKYTPGPWIWHQFGTHWALCTTHSGMLIVLDTERKGMNGSSFRVRAADRCLMIPFTPEHPDAKAIAAVPDLIEALKEVLRISDRRHDVWDRAKEALKKAGAL